MVERIDLVNACEVSPGVEMLTVEERWTEQEPHLWFWTRPVERSKTVTYVWGLGSERWHDGEHWVADSLKASRLFEIWQGVEIQRRLDKVIAAP